MLIKVLSRMLHHIEEGGFIQGFHAGMAEVDGLCISHLLFVDDTILFCDANPKQLLYIRMVHTCFKEVTRL